MKLILSEVASSVLDMTLAPGLVCPDVDDEGAADDEVTLDDEEAVDYEEAVEDGGRRIRGSC